MRRWVLLLATLWPMAYAVVFFVLLIRAIATDGAAAEVFSPYLVAAHVLAFATSIALLIIYVRDLLRRELPQQTQAIWGVLMGLFGPWAMLPYWWRYLRA